MASTCPHPLWAVHCNEQRTESSVSWNYEEGTQRTIPWIANIHHWQGKMSTNHIDLKLAGVYEELTRDTTEYIIG